MNILIVLLLLFFIIINLKFKFSIYFNLVNLDYYFSIKIPLFKNIKLKGDLVKISRKVISNDYKKNIMETTKKDFDIILKYIEIEKLNINVFAGFVLLFPTVFAVPILSTIIDSIKFVPFKKLNNFNYSIMPVYNKLKINIEIETFVKIRVFDILRIIIELIFKK